MTPACRLLKSNKIEFSIHEYEHDSNAKSFGLEAAEKLNLDVREVFKTLMVSDDKNFFVAVLPVNHGEFKHEVRQFEKSYDNQQAEQISLMV